MIGAATGHVEISPTAFLVSDCFDIYLAGWGGSLNINNSQATFSTTNGFLVTPDAHQGTTNGDNFPGISWRRELLHNQSGNSSPSN